jgi:hypothetical protein
MEWNSVDSQEPEPNASVNPDVFHGDLFGDELMDIYHIVTDEGTDEDPVMIPNGMHSSLINLNFIYLLNQLCIFHRLVNYSSCVG